MSGFFEAGTGAPFLNGYFDADTGRRISEREAHRRMSLEHETLTRRYRIRGQYAEAEHQKDLAIYHREMARRSSTSTNPREGHCFISTACVEAAGLPDNCLELQTLRGFRDYYVAQQQGGEALIQKYYLIAPSIVRAIQERNDAHDFFARIFEEDIVTAVELIKKGDFECALKHYTTMVSRLKSNLSH